MLKPGFLLFLTRQVLSTSLQIIGVGLVYLNELHNVLPCLQHRNRVRLGNEIHWIL